ncbi:NAD-dependent epimerase/dehydratase family protein [Streptomyces europaeiscabiei]|uniref:NAD-dependent epimerase/dehydratase family protein n=1 Tax=Streptomyces europaeiscabiei TaxID=146819 RepID=UPI0029BF78E6|nr:NAD-dependent epimerase/dehydratase family protein [Streptomyces europaeiscabiei]MDX2525300.1 NAD-dependent epimerase/dehydratase family protein [Streptomyces europaeiscabiei]
MADRVLITGGAGFIGVHLGRRLVSEGCDVTLLDDFSRGVMDEELAELSRAARLVRHDLSEPVPDTLLSGDFDVVYHLAALVGVRRALDDPTGVLRTNVQATVHLLDYCDRNQPGTVFLSSTSEVGDGAAQLGLASLPTAEDAPFALARLHHPRASYALSKAISEAMLHARADRFRVRIGRYYNVFGPRMGSAHVIPQFIERLESGVDPFPVYGGDQRRAFCYVDDAVAATVNLAALPSREPVLANIGNDREEITMFELARRLMEMTGAWRTMSAMPPPSASPQRRLPDLRTLRTLLPSLPVTDLDTGLGEVLGWYRRRGSLTRLEWTP